MSLSIPSVHELNPRKASLDGGVAVGVAVAVGVVVAVAVGVAVGVTVGVDVAVAVGVVVGVAVGVAVTVAVGVTSGQPDAHVERRLKCENEHTDGGALKTRPFWLLQTVVQSVAFDTKSVQD